MVLHVICFHQDIDNFFGYPLVVALVFSWWGMIGAGVYLIWARIYLRFRGELQSASSLIRAIKLQLIEVTSINNVSMKNSVDVLCILRSIVVQGRPTKAPRTVELVWSPPSCSWVKVYINGATRGYWLGWYFWRSQRTCSWLFCEFA